MDSLEGLIWAMLEEMNIDLEENNDNAEIADDYIDIINNHIKSHTANKISQSIKLSRELIYIKSGHRNQLKYSPDEIIELCK